MKTKKKRPDWSGRPLPRPLLPLPHFRPGGYPPAAPRRASKRGRAESSMNRSKVLSGAFLALALGMVALLVVLATGGGDSMRRIFAGARDIAPDTSARARMSDRRPTPTPAPTPEPTPTPVPEPEPIVVAKADKATSEPIELALLKPPGAIHGWIENAQGLPVEQAEVRLEFDNLVKDGKKAPPIKTQSQASGRFVFEKVPPGSWTAIAEHPGYSVGTAAGVKVVSETATTDVEIVIQPAVELKGTVKTVGDTVLSGVSVAVARSVLTVPQADGAIARREVYYREITSDANGKFVLQKVAPGPSVLAAFLEGYAPEHVEYIVPADNSGNVEIVLSAAAPLGGIVRDIEGRPLQGAVVDLADPGDKRVAEKSETGRKGEFLFRNLRSGHAYRLSASAPNYAPSTPALVESGRTNLVIVLGAGGGIAGKVVRLETKQPEPGVPLLLANKSPEFPFEKRTDSASDGTYVFGDLPSGTYDVRVDSERLVSEPRLGVAVKIPDVAQNVDFAVYPGQEIEGIVLDAVTSDRVPFATVKIEAEAGAAQLAPRNATAIADDLGQFRATGLPYGAFNFFATKEGYLKDPGAQGRVRVRLEPDAVLEPITLLAWRGGTIVGTVLDDKGAPVADAALRLFKAPGTKMKLDVSTFAAVSDAAGRFEIAGIPVDKQVDAIVGATATGHAKGKSDPVILSEFFPTAEVDIRLGPGSPLTVRVKEKGGILVTDADVSLTHYEFSGDPAPPSWTGKTNTTGEAVFANIPEGSGVATASKKGYTTHSAGFRIVEGEPGRVDIELERGIVIKGVVVDDMGRTIEKGTVSATAQAGAKGKGSGAIGSDGRFEISGVGGDGTFRLSVDAYRQAPCGETRTGKVFNGVSPDQGDVLLTVPFNAAVAGIVIDAETVLPVAGAKVVAENRIPVAGSSPKRVLFECATAANGEFALPHLYPDKWKITVSTTEHIPHVVPETPIGSPERLWLGTIVLRKGASLKGRAVSEATGDPVVGALVKLLPLERETRTNQNGEFAIATIPPDIYTLTIDHGRFLPWRDDLVQIVSREDAQDLGTIELLSGGRIRGRVADENGKGVVSAEVIVRNVEDDARRNATTDSSGVVLVEGLAAGNYSVTVTGRFARGRVTKSVLLLVVDDDIAEFDMTLAGHLAIRGNLVGPPGYMTKPRLDLYPLEPNGNPVVGGRIAATIKGLQYEAAELVEGAYLLAANAVVDGEPRFWHRTVQLDPPGATVDVRAGSAVIGGAVLEGRERYPVPNASVRVRALTFPQTGAPALNRWWEWTGRTNDAGTWRVRYLHSGTYEVLVRPPGSPDATPEIVTVRSGEDRQVNVVIGGEAQQRSMMGLEGN